MKLFWYGAVIGAVITSLSWWSIDRYHDKYVPEVPFNEVGTYKIRSTSRYLVIEKNSSGTHFTLHRDEQSNIGESASNILISDDWFKSEDWFTYVDTESRVWLYNGENELIVLVERDGTPYSYDARDFTPEDALLIKLPYSYARQTWDNDVQKRWHELDQCEQSASCNPLPAAEFR